MVHARLKRRNKKARLTVYYLGEAGLLKGDMNFIYLIFGLIARWQTSTRRIRHRCRIAAHIIDARIAFRHCAFAVGAPESAAVFTAKDGIRT